MPLRILIADDERAARYGMAKALAPAGYEIAEAVDGPAALDAIRSGAHDLVFLDLNMPGLDGQGVLRQLCQTGRRAVEVVVVTADDRVQSAVECVRLGAADYLTKPYEIEHVRAIARRAAERLELEQRVDRLQASSTSNRRSGRWSASAGRCAICTPRSSGRRPPRSTCSSAARPGPARS
jgi:CheY-like chemotaxis protein